MDFSNLFAGIEPGGMKDIYEIKILICYLLNAMKEPLSKEQMDAVLEGNQLVSYFSYAAAYKELLQSGHLHLEEQDGREVLCLDELGRHTALMLKTNLPLSVRDKVVSAGMEIIAGMNRDKAREVSAEPCGNGYSVRLVIHDEDVDLVDVRLFAPDMEQVEIIKKQFTDNTVDVYKGLIALLIRDGAGLKEIADRLTPQEKQ